MRTLIVTVGTSLLTNDDRNEPEESRRPWAGWKYEDVLPDAGVLSQHLKTADLQKLSAETNTLRALPVMEKDRLVVLHSHTPEGKFCAEALKLIYEPQGFDVALREIGLLGYKESAFQDQGLKALISILFEEVNKSERAGHQPIFCATGGFKAEIAMVNMVGMLRGIEVCYMHEKFRDLIRFPALPIEWDVDVVERNLSFFDWIDSDMRKATEVESRLHQFPEVRMLTELLDDGYAVLSSAGNLLFQAYKNQTGRLPQAIWPESSERSPSEKNGISSMEHHRPPSWEKVVDLICRINCVHDVRYEGSAPSGSRGAGILKTDAETGGILAVYEKQGKRLPMWIETTARGEAQTQLVTDYIGRRLKG